MSNNSSVTCPATHVLLIEDNPTDAYLVKDMLASLEGPRYLIQLVETLGQALSLLTRIKFDVALLDLSLPDAYGVENVTAICEAATYLPVVILTGFNDEQTGRKALQLGAQDYLLKEDFTPRGLARTLDFAIERKKLHSEREVLIKQLQEALQNIKTFSGLLPICCDCKKIRTSNGAWQKLENYLAERSDATFTHGLCPECGDRMMAGMKFQNLKKGE